MDNKEVILCILEGKKPDMAIFHQIKSTFFKSRDVEFFYIGISIYDFYNRILKYKNDIGFIDVFPIIKQIIIDQQKEKEFVKFKEFLELKQNQISEIFLFFDYDGQDKDNSTKNPNTIDEMLDFFDNETVFGKLYVNYPMAESYKHRIDGNIEFFSINNEIHYKTFVASICDKKLEQISKLDRKDWLQVFLPHLKSTNHLFSNQFLLPNTYLETQKMSQLSIYHQQKQQYIQPNQKIMILSSFSWFLLEYLGEKLFLEWQEIDSH